jgi:hypothetical protein
MCSFVLAQRFRKPAFLAGALVAFGFCASADTIVSVTDSSTPVNRGALFLGGQLSNVVASLWTQTASFSDVTIDASLTSEDPTFLSGTAYLMSAIGPGTTPGSEVVAPADFTVPFASHAGSVTPTVLFTGLDLGPGNYYLVLTAPSQTQTVLGSPLSWQIPTNPLVSTENSFLGNGAFSYEANSGIQQSIRFPRPRALLPQAC